MRTYFLAIRQELRLTQLLSLVLSVLITSTFLWTTLTVPVQATPLTPVYLAQASDSEADLQEKAEEAVDELAGEGTADKVEGKIKEAAGQAQEKMGKAEEEVKGTAKQLEGKAQQTMGEAKGRAEEAGEELDEASDNLLDAVKDFFGQ